MNMNNIIFLLVSMHITVHIYCIHDYAKCETDEVIITDINFDVSF